MKERKGGKHLRNLADLETSREVLKYEPPRAATHICLPQCQFYKGLIAQRIPLGRGPPELSGDRATVQRAERPFPSQKREFSALSHSHHICMTSSTTTGEQPAQQTSANKSHFTAHVLPQRPRHRLISRLKQEHTQRRGAGLRPHSDSTDTITLKWLHLEPSKNYFPEYI